MKNQVKVKVSLLRFKPNTEKDFWWMMEITVLTCCMEPKWMKPSLLVWRTYTVFCNGFWDCVFGVYDFYRWSLRSFRCSCSVVSDSLCDPMNYSPLGFSVHGIFQAKILEQFTVSSPGDLPNPGTEPEICDFYMLLFTCLRLQCRIIL